jgi:hypothetical protein
LKHWFGDGLKDVTIKSLGSLCSFFLIAFLFTCLVDHAAAQGNTTDLHGVITDPSGANVSGRWQSPTRPLGVKQGAHLPHLRRGHLWFRPLSA